MTLPRFHYPEIFHNPSSFLGHLAAAIDASGCMSGQTAYTTVKYAKLVNGE